MNGYYHNSSFRIKPGAKGLKRTQMKHVSGKPLKRSTKPKPMKKVGKKGKRDNPKLAEWRREVRERDNYTCQYSGCGRSSKYIDVHHIAKRTERPDLKFAVSNGVCLCREHHGWTDTHLKEAIEIGLRNTQSYELAMKSRAA